MRHLQADDIVKINIDQYIKLLITKCQIVGTFNKK